MRKLFHGVLNVKSSMEYLPYQDLESTQLLFDLCKSPLDFRSHLQRYANSITTSMVYGWRVSSSDDPRLAQLFESVARFFAMIQKPASMLLQVFPFLKRFSSVIPVVGEARTHHISEAALYQRFWLECKNRILEKTAPPCLCVNMVQSQNELGFTDLFAAYSAGSMLEAGSDTTSATLYAFIEAMVLFPEAQAQVQAEIDHVIGSSRLPTWEDSPNLP